jgi:hypothetical protein
MTNKITVIEPVGIVNELEIEEIDHVIAPGIIVGD